MMSAEYSDNVLNQKFPVADPGKKSAATSPLRPLDTSLFDDLQIVLDVHLGQATMTMGELRALKPNAIVPLDIKLDQLATVKFKGVIIARGEIVAVDDSFGLRIVEIAPGTAA
jgi:flagellar motor switch protein FliN/FliY